MTCALPLNENIWNEYYGCIEKCLCLTGILFVAWGLVTRNATPSTEFETELLTNERGTIPMSQRDTIPVPSRDCPLLNVHFHVAKLSDSERYDSDANATKLLILGEGRSGTSVLLDMLSSTLAFGGKVFSIYEPFKPFYEDSIARNVSMFPGGLDALFDCSFTRRPRGLHALNFFARVQSVKRGTGKPEDEDCRFSSHMLQNRSASPHALEASVHHACISSTVRIAKVIRFKDAMMRIPKGDLRSSLKVLHIVRHPVPLTASRKRVAFEMTYANGTTIKDNDQISRLCTRSVTRSKYIHSVLNPDQIVEIKYEDLVSNTASVWQRLALLFHVTTFGTSLEGPKSEVLRSILGQNHVGKRNYGDGTFHFQAERIKGNEEAMSHQARQGCDEFLHRFGYS